MRFFVINLETIKEPTFGNRTSIPINRESADKVLDIKYQHNHQQPQREEGISIENMPQSQALLDRLRLFEDAQKRVNVHSPMKTNPLISGLKLPERRNSDRDPPRSMRNLTDENRVRKI